MRQLLSLLLLATLSGCDGGTAGTQTNAKNGNAAPTANSGASPNATRGAPPGDVPVYGYEVVNAYPHDPDAFTQGLIFDDGSLVESTGLEKHSTLRRVELQTGKVLQKVDVPSLYFAEGMTLFGGKIYQLTWKAEKGFVYDPKTFEKTGEFTYAGEGWGLTHDADSLILSDGSDQIRFIDPNTNEVKRTINVRDGGRRVSQLNELEYVRVKGWIDLSGLLKSGETSDEEAVLNGIAYDEQGDRLFVTGKLWPKLFEIKLRQK